MPRSTLDEITDIQSFVVRCEANVKEMQCDDPARRYQAYIILESLIERFENQYKFDDPEVIKFVSFCVSACVDYFIHQKAQDEPMFQALAAQGRSSPR